jgi:hypothetical protein
MRTPIPKENMNLAALRIIFFTAQNGVTTTNVEQTRRILRK